MQNLDNKTHISVAELAKLLKVSRIAVFKRIKKGQIPAMKIGRSYAITSKDVDRIINGAYSENITNTEKEEIRKAVEKTVDEYGETLRLLGKE